VCYEEQKMVNRSNRNNRNPDQFQDDIHICLFNTVITEYCEVKID